MGMNLVLRPYQEEAIRCARAEIAKGIKRVVMYGPTGSGKSALIEAMASNAVSKGKRVAIIANRIHLINQLSKRFTSAGISHGIIQGENSHTIHAQVVICSIQTVARRGLPLVDAIFIDEGHACPGSKDYRNIIFKNNNLPVISFTATPFSRGMAQNHVELGGEPLFGSMVVSTTIQELIDGGFLVDCDIYAPSEPDMTGIKQSKNKFGELDWADSDIGRAVDKPQLIGDIVSHWLKLSNGLPTVCFASNIAHSKHIVESFRAVGVVAEHIDCYTEEEDRLAILARVESGETTVLSNVSLLTEGWDFPACRTMILARPTKSLIRYIQMIGRVLRPHATKERALVIDHSGTVQRLGFPTDDLPLELDDGRAKEAAKPKAEEALPKKCPQCHAIKPPKMAICPKCGFQQVMANTVESIDGELTLVQKGKLKATAAEKQLFYSELLALKGKRSDGWVAHAYKDKFGVWPRGMKDIPTDPRPETRSWVTAKMIRFAKGQEARHAA